MHILPFKQRAPDRDKLVINPQILQFETPKHSTMDVCTGSNFPKAIHLAYEPVQSSLCFKPNA